MKELAGRVAVITGSGSGIGRATATALASEGVRVVVADMNLVGASETVERIAASGGSALAIEADVTRDGCFELLKAAALKNFGRVDIVMNNAGGITRGLPEHTPLAEWQRVLDLNLLSVVSSIHAFTPHLIAQGEGHVVNTASFAGLFTYSFDRLPYAAAKAAVVQISEGLALYLRPKGIGVTCLCPGPVRTNIMSSLRQFGPPTDTLAPGPQYTLKEPEEVGRMVVEAIRSDRFMLPTDDQVIEQLSRRAADWDAFLQERIDHPHIGARADAASN